MFRYREYSLLLKEPFGTAHGIRDRTDGMLVALSDGNVTGFGEVFMPPYYPENVGTMTEFFESLDADKLLGTLDSSLDYLHGAGSGNRGAKAAVDIALHDFFGKTNGCSFLDFYEPAADPKPLITSYTIGFDDVDTMVRKAVAAAGFQILKIKLNGEDDVEIVGQIAEHVDAELYVDLNQGWTDVEAAVETAESLTELGVGLIEQPFPVGRYEDAARLRDSLDVPMIADEDLQTIEQLDDIAGCYDGVNIKLMKSGGIRPAIELIQRAKELGLSILLGCMTESSIGISAAARLGQFADWCDLDGNLLIKNDTCSGVDTVKGELVDNGEPGIGIDDDVRLREFLGV